MESSFIHFLDGSPSSPSSPALFLAAGQAVLGTQL